MKWEKESSFSIDIGLKSNLQAPLSLNYVRPGTFMMGSPLDEPGCSDWDDEPSFKVTISKGYWLAQYLTTNIQWLQVMNSLPYPLSEENANRPVTGISWQEASEFCEKLNKIVKMSLPDDYLFRLPTEAQWEYACRAGTQTVYYSGNSLSDLDRVAWHKENSHGHPHPVGEKEPNAWGFYDMHGNVAEWCWDGFHPYPQSPTVDLISINKGPLEIKIVRGGMWTASPTDGSFRCSCRMTYLKDKGLPHLGFRVSLRTIENTEILL